MKRNNQVTRLDFRMNHMDRMHNLDDRENLEIEREVLRAIKSIRYGSVEIIVHDSRVVQIERKEKVRFDKGAPQKRK